MATVGSAIVLFAIVCDHMETSLNSKLRSQVISCDCLLRVAIPNSSSRSKLRKFLRFVYIKNLSDDVFMFAHVLSIVELFIALITW